jgi:Raf kinase inhibitor-like YbhB/YbcL family protein
MALQIRSSAFGSGEPIPKKHTGDGQDLSPPLTWSELPPGAAELALICDDPDAPTAEPWVHWVIYRLPVDLTGLPEGVEPSSRPQNVPGAVQGVNSWSSGVTIGYRGPAPPPGHGVHHYHFTLYSLDTPLQARPSLTKNDLLAAMSGHVLATERLIGTYERPRR